MASSEANFPTTVAGPARGGVVPSGVRLDDGGREDAYLVVRPQHVEVVDAVAEAVEIAKHARGRGDDEMKRSATLLAVAHRLHAHLGDGLRDALDPRRRR